MEVDLGHVLEALPGSVWTALPDGRAEYFGKRWLDYTGVSFEDAVGLGWTASVQPDDAPRLMAAWNEITASGTPGEVEARLRRYDGEYRWQRIMVAPLRNTAGDIEVWYGLSTDIEDAKHAEAKLAAEKQLLEFVARGGSLRQTLEALCRHVEALAWDSCCAILLIDADSGTFRVGAARSLPDEYIATFEGRRIDPSDAPSALAAALKMPVIAADVLNDPRWQGSPLPRRLVDHGLRSCWAMPILSGANNVLGVFAAYHRQAQAPTQDEHELIERFAHIAGIAIERDQAESALKASGAELRRTNLYLTEAQRLSKTGSFSWDVRADRHEWSDEGRRIWEFDPAAPITLPMILTAVHPDDLPLAEAVIGQATRGAPGFELTFRIVTKSGTLKHLHCVGHRLEHVVDRPVFVGAIQDITERKAAEDGLDRARAELAHVARVTTLSALTASIAHEVNQPLAGIITNASTCVRMLAAHPPNLEGARATAQRTIRDGNRASQVIQRLRALFTHRPAAVEPFDLNTVAGEVLALCSGELRAASAIVSCEVANDLPPVSGDRIQLQQVILNLLINAADSMKAVVDRPRLLTVRTWRAASDKVALSVRDSGVGLEPEHLERLFDAFYTTKTGGMGVGLAISRSIIESHGGRLWGEPNRDGPGATFGFSIPAALDALSFGSTGADTMAGNFK